MSALTTPLPTAREEAAVELTAEEEAQLDQDPLQRLYDSNKIEAPAQLSTLLGVFTKLVLVQGREDLNEFAQEFFEHCKLARAADPKIDYDKFISTQLKILEKKYAPSVYDLESEFAPPAGLQQMLTAFSKEVIRYQPGTDGALLGFALEYFNAAVDDGSPEEFLRKQCKLAEEKQRAVDLEKKRTQLAKAKQKKKLAMS